MDAVAILHIAAANWPIKVLRISGTPFDVDMAAKLADLQLPNLIQLYLMEADLTAPAVSELVRASWPSLNYISIDHSDLAALTTLFECHLEKVPGLDMDPRIRYLDTVHRSFAWPIVPMGLWPNLKYVMISKHNVTCFLN